MCAAARVEPKRLPDEEPPGRPAYPGRLVVIRPSLEEITDRHELGLILRAFQKAGKWTSAACIASVSLTGGNAACRRSLPVNQMELTMKVLEALASAITAGGIDDIFRGHGGCQSGHQC
jgi:hypothetical protein